MRSCTVWWLLLLLLVPAEAVRAQNAAPEPGLTAVLAAHRARTISNLRYDLGFRVPADADAAIDGTLTLRFSLSDAAQPLVLDFDAAEPHVASVSSGGVPVSFELVNGHVVIPTVALKRGANELRMRFTAGDGSLNRNPDFLYTLFVPDRASNAFPSFDQPDLKAVYSLTLDVPADWQAVANGAEQDVVEDGGRRRITFAPTAPISTYLFSFAAGKFAVETAERDGRTMRMFHRETDAAKLARSRDTIFDLHAAALRWLEDYTGIPYPFGKFDFVLVPSFQYGGMEHPGAILYNAGRMLLEPAPTQNEQLGRASLIAHETAHMWFGDLVTMQWFDDVWMKEVFANFMAAKIVNPAFPDIDHDLRFVLAHHPTAYSVDRTAGTHAIRQQLDNLNEAGSLYGAIIYQKAPVVMRQLEVIVGEAAFRDGMREYLRDYAFGNATWRDLVDILDRRTPQDLSAWSRVWVEESGRPHVRVEVDIEDGRVSELTLHQEDPAGRGRVWPQRVDVQLTWQNSALTLPVVSDAPAVQVAAAAGQAMPRYVLPDARGLGYGRFMLDEATRSFLLDSLAAVSPAVARGTAVLALQDAMLSGEVAPAALLNALMTAVATEGEQLLTARYLGMIGGVFWRFLKPDARAQVAPALERLLWRGLSEAADASAKASWFAAVRNVALTEASVARLHAVWARTDSIPGLPLAERDYTALAEELALRGVAQSRDVLQEQLGRIENADRRARFEFILPALSADPAVRDSFFASLADVRNRSHEPWVTDGLAMLNHPLRADQALEYIRPALELLPEIQRTGDIFFPRRWVDAMLSGHATPEAAAEVRAYLDQTPDLAPRLRGIVLQAADDLFRAAALR
ncbi:MAG TPA: M1 family aminopeptidase [Longimicrobiales bacterium]|nr:M1 family aminopeptidase [Longimicrobiales bacterium]